MLDNGIFTDGSEPMLWRPDLDHARLRREALAEAVLPEAAPFAFIGSAVAVLIGAWIGLVIALLVVAAAMLLAVSTYRCWGLDCTRPRFTRHRRDRGGGQWFYRPADFTALPANCRDQVDRLFMALVVFDEQAVLAWLPDTERHQVHRAAWTVLDCLHATLPARAILHRVAPDLAADKAVTEVRHQLVLLDTAIAGAVHALCETSSVVADLSARLTAPRRRAALHEDVYCLRLPAAPAVDELCEDIRSRTLAVHEVLDLAGITP
jgi:hypothetical protein